MNEKVTDWICEHSALVSYIVLVILMLGVFFYGRSYGRESTVNNNVNERLQDVKGNTAAAGNYIATAQDEISSAENSVNGASQTIRESRESAEEIARRIDECEKYVDQSISYNRKAQAILDGVGKGNRAGEGKGETE